MSDTDTGFGDIWKHENMRTSPCLALKNFKWWVVGISSEYIGHVMCMEPVMCILLTQIF